MRTPAPDSRPVALTIAGSDSGGGAGIQADLATMAAHGVFGTSAITAVTAQNTRGVSSSHVLPTDEIDAQLEAVTDDFAIGAAKTGMLATTDVIETVAEHARTFTFPLVVDPVMVATSGDRLLEPDAERAYEELLGRATLATPNTDEAEVLTDIAVTDDESAVAAGEAILETGVDAVLVKGGHLPGETVRDILVTDGSVRTFEHPRVGTEATHGSGCTLGSAIAARLAAGDPLETAVEGATEFLERAVRYYYDVGEGHGAVNHMVSLRNEAARERTAEDVQAVVDRFVEADVSALVPEVGMNVVGATPYADSVAETAAVEGRITRTLSGVQPNRGVRFGARVTSLASSSRHGSSPPTCGSLSTAGSTRPSRTRSRPSRGRSPSTTATDSRTRSGRRRTVRWDGVPGRPSRIATSPPSPSSTAVRSARRRSSNSSRTIRRRSPIERWRSTER